MHVRTDRIDEGTRLAGQRPSGYWNRRSPERFLQLSESCAGTLEALGNKMEPRKKQRPAKQDEAEAPTIETHTRRAMRLYRTTRRSARLGAPLPMKGGHDPTRSDEQLPKLLRFKPTCACDPQGAWRRCLPARLLRRTSAKMGSTKYITIGTIGSFSIEQRSSPDLFALFRPHEILPQRRFGGSSLLHNIRAPQGAFATAARAKSLT